MSILRVGATPAVGIFFIREPLLELAIVIEQEGSIQLTKDQVLFIYELSCFDEIYRAFPFDNDKELVQSG